jgi:hypothetical protein
MDFPTEFRCPITMQIMTDPVQAADGHTYERSAITTWLVHCQQSPITRSHMTAEELVPNRALRSAIEHYTTSRPPPAPSVSLFKPEPVTLTVVKPTDGGDIHVQIATPADGERKPIVVLAMIDNSGSMDAPAGAVEGGEQNGLSRLDLVKHATNTIAAMLGDQDKLGIVSFTTTARTVLPVTSMNDEGKSRVRASLETIKPDGSTNIWDGIRVAALLANADELKDHHIVAMLLTDGFPNINPPRGILPSLKSSLPMKNPWSLHAFGFGYSLDSVLLSEIAEFGNGLFGFIPDCTMVGTVFINFMATMLATAHQGVMFDVQYADGNKVTVNTGPLAYGQPRDYVFPGSSFVNVYYEGESVGATASPINSHAYVHEAYMRTIDRAIQFCKMGQTDQATSRLAAFEVTHSSSSDANVRALLRDLRSPTASEGQVGMAPAYFGKWGEHYMRSYLRAQRMQLCMNFKDPGLQIYGGKLFHDLQSLGDTLFCNLPPPKPSLLDKIRSDPFSYGTNVWTSNAPIDMSMFHNPSGGCFHGDCQILMADRSRKAIKDVLANDMVWTPDGDAKVKAVIVCNQVAKSQPMTQYGALSITPWHPIRISKKTIENVNLMALKGPQDVDYPWMPITLPEERLSTPDDMVWVYPAEVSLYIDRLVQTVYNFWLDHGHIVNVEGVQCCTLAHGFSGPVIEHPYFGTQAVIDDCAKQPGWDVGRPEFANLVAIRENGMIVKWAEGPI